MRLYGNVALVTTKFHNAGTLGGKPYDVLGARPMCGLGKTGLEMCSNPRGLGRRGKRSEATFPLTCDS